MVKAPFTLDPRFFLAIEDLKNSPWFDLRTNYRFDNQGKNLYGIVKISSEDDIYIKGTCDDFDGTQIYFINAISHKELNKTKANIQYLNYNSISSDLILSDKFIKNKKTAMGIFYLDNFWIDSDSPLSETEALNYLFFSNEYGKLMICLEDGDLLSFEMNENNISNIIKQSNRCQSF